MLEPRRCPVTPALGVSSLLCPSLLLPNRARAPWDEHHLPVGRQTGGRLGSPQALPGLRTCTAKATKKFEFGRARKANQALEIRQPWRSAREV